MPIQDVGTIASWTPSRLDKHIANFVNQRNQIAKTSVSADQQYVHGALTFSSGDFQTADTILSRPQTGILWLNGSPIVTPAHPNGFAQLSPYSALQTFGGAISIGGPASTSPGGNNGLWLDSGTGSVLSTTSTATTTFLAASITGDANWRFLSDHNGQLKWGPGGAGALDTTLQRTSAYPPSGTATGIVINNPLFVADPAGLVVVNTVNQQALGVYAATTDTQPVFKIFQQGAFLWGLGGTTAGDLEQARIANGSSGSGAFLELVKGDGIGYGTGTGGAVTQGTSLSTGVTLNKPTGTITLFSSAISAGLYSSFTVACTQCGAHDTVLLSGQNMAGLVFSVTNVVAGSFQISHYSPAGVASATRKINYTLVKGAIA